MDTVSSDSVGRFLTVADTADVLNISTAEVIELVRSAELPAIHVGSSPPKALLSLAHDMGSPENWKTLPLWN